MTIEGTRAPSDWTVAAGQRYRSQGLGGRLRARGGVGLVVVDLQTGFTDSRCGPGFDLTSVVASTNTLSEAAHAGAAAVFYSLIAFDEEDRDLVWLEKMPVLAELAAGSPWVELDPRLGEVDARLIIVKKAASAFAGTDLTARLRALNVGTLIVVGATTSGCVRATAVDACTAGFATYVVRDCVGDREEGPHDAALFDLDAKYADVIGLEDAVALLHSNVTAASTPAGLVDEEVT